MKQMIKKMREEKGGFTLAELLVVVAIIAVLVAIAIPVFSASLTKAQYETDVANARSFYAEATVEYLSDGAVTATYNYEYQNPKGETKLTADADGAPVVTYTSGLDQGDYPDVEFSQAKMGA